MARHKNIDWQLGDRPTTWDEVNAAILMDIRDELIRLNGLLICPNFMAIPHTLRRICANTRKPKRRKKK